MNHILKIIIENAALFIELIGVFVIIMSIVGVLFTFFKSKFNFELTNRTSKLNSGLAFALEILLASEILKTLIAQDLSNLMELGALVGIRIIMTVLIHWELTLAQKHQEKK